LLEYMLGIICKPAHGSLLSVYNKEKNTTPQGSPKRCTILVKIEFFRKTT
jgi:hypothetical protein